MALEIESWSNYLKILLVVLIVAAGFVFEGVRLTALLIIVAIVLIQLRESGERLDFDQRQVNFEIVSRGDADPLPIRVYGSSKQEQSCSFRAESREIDGIRRQVPFRVITDDCSVFFGERLTGLGRLRPSQEQRVAGTLIIDEISERDSKLIWQALDQIRKKYRSLFIDLSDAGSLVPGMVIGDTSLQSEEFDAAMRLAGLSHLTAVSGANFSIVATMVLWLVSLRIRDKRIRIFITAATLLFFTIIVRPSPSVLRAGVMAAVVLFAQLRGNQRSSILALAGAVAILLLVDPYQGSDAGFALSVLATLGIILISPRVVEWLTSHWRLPKVIAEVIAIPVAATLLCSPIVIAISGKFSVASIPLNIVAAPLVPVVTLAGFLAFLSLPFASLAHFSTLASLLSDFLGHLAYLAAWPIARMATWSHHAPILEMPFGILGGFLFLLALIVILIGVRNLRTRRHRLMGVLALILVPLSALLVTYEHRQWQLYQCDVGQGDALLIRTSQTSAMVIDVGPDPSRIDRCLRMAGVRSISLLVITHLHADHYGGITGALRGREVQQWWIAPDSSLASEEVVSELASLIGAQPTIVRAGSSYLLNSISIEVLWPEDGSVIAPRLGGDGSEQNNRSIALLIEKDGATIFTGGDIEPYAQERIARSHDLSQVEIYKVSHHGAALRSPFFDEILNPVVALISVGEQNPYGHPAPEAIDALAPATIFRTDLDGPLRLTWWPIRVR